MSLLRLRELTMLAAGAMACTLGVAQAFAQCLPEVEPNNEITELKSRSDAPVCLTGVVQSSDQDIALVAIPGTAERRLWQVRLDLLPGQSGAITLAKPASPSAGAAPDDITTRLGFDAGAAPVTMWQQSTAPGEANIESPLLLLDPGVYLLAVATTEKTAVWRARLEPAGALPPALALPAEQAGAFRRSITGTGEPLELRWTLSSGDAAQRWKIALQLAPRAYATLTLNDAEGHEITYSSVADADGAIRLRDLGLAPATYRVQLTNFAAGVPAIMSAEPEGPRFADFAEEPDDIDRGAHTITPERPWRGRLIKRGDADDVDNFTLVIDEALSRRKLDIVARATSDARLTLTLSEAGGATLMERDRKREVRLRDLTLPVGNYRLALRGILTENETYTFAVEDRGSADETAEREPNDAAAHAMPMDANKPYSGSFDGRDRDFLKLKVEGGLQLWNFSVTGTGISSLSLYDSTGTVVASESNYGGATSLQLSRLLLAPGEHTLLLEGEGGSWLARATSLGAPAPGDEVEPNDAASDAMLLRFDGPQRLWLDRKGDQDRYAFYLAAAHRVSLSLEAPAEFSSTMRLEWTPASDPLASVDTSTGADGMEHAHFDRVLPAGDYQLIVTSNAGRTRDPLSLSATLGPPFEMPPAGTGLVAALVPETDRIAAFTAEGQRVGARLSITNNSGVANILTPQAWFGDERWRVEGLPERIELGAGKTQEFALTLLVAPDVRDDWPVQVAVALEEGGVTLGLANVALTARIGAEPASPHWASELPAALEGGINVAWSALGATSNAPAMIDGLLDGKPVAIPTDQGITVDLAGDAPVPVRGFVLVPQSSEIPQESLRRFAIEVSADGATFTRVLEGTLSPLSRQQGFVLPEAASARHVRLIALDHQGSREGGRITLSEFKVISQRGRFVPAIDVARPELGGHMVWTNPQTDNPVTGETVAWPGKYLVGFRAKQPVQPEFVFGFRTSRAPLIDSISMALDPQTTDPRAIRRVRVFSSNEGPFGPWTEIGVLAPAGSDKRATLSLDAPVFVRHLRFVIEEPGTGEVDLPKSIEVKEHPADMNYRSIIGEWETSSPASEFERQQESKVAASSTVAARHDRGSAAALAPDEVAAGRVRFGADMDWYRLDLPPDAKVLRIRLSGRPAVDAAVAIEDAQGKPVTLTPDGGQPGDYIARVAGGVHYARIWQPGRSLIVSWDTSMSVSAFVPTITRVVRRLSSDLETGREAINLVPFRGDATAPLLKTFAETREDVWSSLHSYVGDNMDSDAERALIVSAKALQSRQGPRAIVLITDASSDGAMRNAELWRMLDATRPRIFTLHIPTGELDSRGRAQTNLMQDWAFASGGFYSQVGSPSEAESAFRRLAARMRMPADYSFSYRYATAPAEPGRLAVTWAPGTEASTGGKPKVAVEIILDASGSMLKSIAGRRRIAIAKSVLQDLGRTVLPDGLPVALRVFGHTRPGSCETELFIPMGALDRKAFNRAVERIRSVNLSKTAIAESLRKAGEDLAGVTGTRFIVLITDGEETCGGNPEVEIKRLREQGIGIQLNIVGFAVDNAATRELFLRWSAAGGGSYFDAADMKGLQAGIRKATALQFTLIDSTGTEVARGSTDGKVMEIPPGKYRLQIPVLGAEFPVAVKSGETTTVNANATGH